MTHTQNPAERPDDDNRDEAGSATADAEQFVPRDPGMAVAFLNLGFTLKRYSGL